MVEVCCRSISLWWLTGDERNSSMYSVQRESVKAKDHLFGSLPQGRGHGKAKERVSSVWN